MNITKNEFFDYYLDVNAVIPIEKEEYFNDILISTWGVTSSYDYVSPARIKELEGIFYEKVRQHTVHKKDEVIIKIINFIYITL